jgi:flagellar hook assembly protein FlgD
MTKRVFLFLLGLLTLSSSGLHAYVEGDPLFLQSYIINSSTPPAPTITGIVATGGLENLWGAAYARTNTFQGPGGSVPNVTMFACNDGTYLYFAMTWPSGNAASSHECYLYINRGDDHVLAGNGVLGTSDLKIQWTPGSNGTTLGTPTVYAYNGTSWAGSPSSTPAGWSAGSAYNSGGGNHVWNFEWKIPLSDLGVSWNTKIGILPVVNDTASGPGLTYWDPTNECVDDAGLAVTGCSINTDGWGDLQLGYAPPVRPLPAPVALGNVPTLGQDLTTSTNWNDYTTFQQNVILSDYQGNKKNATFYLKTDTGANNLYVGVLVQGMAVENSADQLTCYFEYAPGSQDYVLESGPNEYAASMQNNPVLAAGTWSTAGTAPYSTYENFNAAAWTAPLAATTCRMAYIGTTYQYEMQIPMSAGAVTGGLTTAPGALLGFNPVFHDGTLGTDFYYTASANSNGQFVDPAIAGTERNALGWSEIQTKGPVLDPLIPQNGGAVSGQQPVVVYAAGLPADPIKPNTTQYSYSTDGGVTWSGWNALVVGGNNLYSGTLDTTGLPNGALKIRFETTTQAGYTSIVPIDVTVNNSSSAATPPSISFLQPSASAIVAGNAYAVTVTANAAGVNTISKVELSIDGGAFVDITGGLAGTGGGNATYPWNTKTLLDGQHLLLAKVTDSAGGVAYTQVESVTVDNTGPQSISLLPIYPSQTCSGYEFITKTVNVQAGVAAGAGVTELGLYYKKVYSAAFLPAVGTDTLIGTTQTAAPWEASWDTTGVANGGYLLKAVATDSSGKILSSTTQLVVVDNATLSVSFAPAPVNPTSYANETITVTASDGVSIPPTVDIDGTVASMSGISGAGPFTFTYKTVVTLAPGANTITASVSDCAGNGAVSATTWVDYDVTAPVSFVNPISGTALKGTVPVEITAPSNAKSVKYQVYNPNTAVWDDLSGTASAFTSASALTYTAGGWQANWDTTLAGFGDKCGYELQATAYDQFGTALGTALLNPVAVDNNAPAGLSINAVFSPTKYNSQTITGQVTEPLYQCVTVSVSVDGVQASLAGTGPVFNYSVFLPLVLGPNGVTVTAVDSLGNSSVAATSIDYNPNGPLSFMTPVTASKLKGTVPVQLTTQFNTVSITVQVSPNGGVTWYDLSGTAGTASVLLPASGWITSYDTTKLPDGPHYEFTATAWDQYGNQIDTEVITQILVDNTPPALSYAFVPAPNLVGGQNQEYGSPVQLTGTVQDSGSMSDHLVIQVTDAAGNPVGSSPVTVSLNSPLTSTAVAFSRSLALVPGLDHVRLTAYDSLGNSTTGLYDLTLVNPNVSQQVCNGGGTVTGADGASVTIPSGALLQCAQVAIQVVPAAQLVSPTVGSNVSLVGNGHDFMPDATVFQKEATLTLPYTLADLDANQDGKPDDPAWCAHLEAFFWDGSTWQKVQNVSSQVNCSVTAGTVTLQVNHEGLYALGLDTSPVPGATKVFLTKNPVRFGSGNPTTFVYDLPAADTVSIKIYDMAGDLVRTLLSGIQQGPGRQTAVWDGLSDSGHYVGSGIYVYQFTTSAGTIKKALGVIK